MFFFRMPARFTAAVLASCLALAPVAAQSDPAPAQPFPSPETLTYTIEWRLITAGTAVLSLERSGGGWQSLLKLDSAGLVSKLYKVDDKLTAHYEGAFCVKNSTMNAIEGKRRRDTHITFDAERKKASYLERDLVKNAIVRQQEIDIPGCVHDVVGALSFLRTRPLEPGHSIELPMSDGKKAVNVRIEAQEREDVKINGVVHKTIRYEAFLLNKVLYQRDGRLFVWIAEDGRRVPVQIRIRTGFPIGTVTLQLEKQQLL